MFVEKNYFDTISVVKYFYIILSNWEFRIPLKNKNQST